MLGNKNYKYATFKSEVYFFSLKKWEKFSKVKNDKQIIMIQAVC